MSKFKKLFAESKSLRLKSDVVFTLKSRLKPPFSKRNPPKSKTEKPTRALYLFILRFHRFVSLSISYLCFSQSGRHSYTKPKSKPKPNFAEAFGIPPPSATN